MKKERSGAIKERILSAVLILPFLVLFTLYAGASLFNGAICLLSALALREFYAMSLPAERRTEAGLSIAVGVVLVALIVFPGFSALRQGGAVFLLIGLLILYLFRYLDIGRVGRDVGISVLGLLYIPVLFAHAGLLRSLPFGIHWVFLVLFLVMASDSAAYFIGRSCGRHKLYEAISPKKTVEGAIGGLGGGVLGVVVFKVLFFPELRFPDVIILGLGIGACSQVGDLFESMLKRSFNVKDSGSLIPGHGGLLDRMDSLLFAFPVTYYYAVWFF